MFFAQNVRYLRKLNNYSQDYIAKKLGYKSFTTIQKWESGESQPPYTRMTELAGLFNVDVNDLTGTDMASSSFVAPHDSICTAVPVYGTIPAGLPVEAIEDVHGYIYMPSNYIRGKQFFALEIRGDSMLPDYRSGDIIVFEQASDCENGDDCAVRVGDCDATFKRVRKQEGCIILQPLNPSYEPIRIDPPYGDLYDPSSPPIEILGIARELRRGL